MRAPHPLDAGAARLPAAGHRRRPRSRCSTSTSRPRRGQLRGRHRAGAAAAADRARRSCSGRDAIRPAAAPGTRVRGSAISSWRRGCRSSSGAASPTTRCSTSRPADGCSEPAVLERRCGGCWPIRRPTRSSTTSPASGCTCATCRTAHPDTAGVPGLRRQPAPGVPAARPSCSSTSIMREDRSVLDLLTADYTFVNERLAGTTASGRLRQPLPPRPVTDDARRGLLGQAAS